MFIDLRDRYGLTQLHIDPANTAIYALAEQLRSEWVIKITWTVRARPAWQSNSDMLTGEVEVEVEELEILTKAKILPFPIADDPKTSEENRFKHRYLDLRRRKIFENIEFRARMNHFTRNWFTEQAFIEVQTPLFTVSSPEGARDYLIPSRVNPGKFYALPQAPQQYKQLLMIGGIDKYFQIAPCFRDEDPRADRHSCEFYQIDVEMSFVHQDDVHAVAQSYIHALIPALSDKTIITPTERLPFLSSVVLEGSDPHFPKIPYTESMELFGSDKPDLRFDCHLVDVSNVFQNTELSFFADILKSNWKIKAIRLAGQVPSRKDIDALTEVAKQWGAGGLPYLQLDVEGLRGSIAKFVDESTLASLQSTTWFSTWDTLLFVLWNTEQTAKAGNKLRLELRDRYQLADTKELAFVWIVNFPFFEMNDEGKMDFCHNPFSIVSWWAETLRQVMEEWLDPLSVMSEQYDMWCNGYELLSWSIRNNSIEVLVKAFEFVGKSEENVKRKFWAMYEAFQYGCPPHGGFAFGFDRLLMILKDETNIREVYAFPKSGRAEDVMMWAPSEIDKEQLDELYIRAIENIV